MMWRPQPLARLSILAPLLALGSLAGAAAAGPPSGAPRGTAGWHHGPPGPPPMDGVLERHADELGLDADTRARIHTLAEHSREAAQPLDDQLRALHDEMHGLLEQESPSPGEVMQQADRIGAAETGLHKQRLQTMLEIRALLTPEQREKLVQIFEARRERWREHGHGGPGCEAAPDAPGQDAP
jgi:protein CpxP